MNRDSALANKGQTDKGTPPHSGEGCGDTLSGVRTRGLSLKKGSSGGVERLQSSPVQSTAGKTGKQLGGHLPGCARDNFRVARVQAQRAEFERVDPIPANRVCIHEATGILTGAGDCHRPASRCKRRDDSDRRLAITNRDTWSTVWGRLDDCVIGAHGFSTADYPMRSPQRQQPLGEGPLFEFRGEGGKIIRPCRA